MDRRTLIGEKALREACRRRPAPLPPLLFTERVMRSVRAERARAIRRENRLILAAIALLPLGAAAAVCLWGGGEEPERLFSWLHLAAWIVPVAAALRALQERLRRRLGLPR